MSSNTDRALLVSIVDYLQSKKGESSNPALLDESIRLLQYSFGLSLTGRLSFNMNNRDAETRPDGMSIDLFSIFDNVLVVPLSDAVVP